MATRRPRSRSLGEGEEGSDHPLSPFNVQRMCQQKAYTHSEECIVTLYTLTHAHPYSQNIQSSLWSIISSWPHIRAASSHCLGCAPQNYEGPQSRCEWHPLEWSNTVALLTVTWERARETWPILSLVETDAQKQPVTSPRVTELVNSWKKICVILYLPSPRQALQKEFFFLSKTIYFKNKPCSNCFLSICF